MREPPLEARRARIDADAAASALDASGTGVWVWDADTGLVVWDDNLEALCGLAPGEFGGTYDAWVASLHPDDREGVIAVIAGAFASGHDYQFEYRVAWPDGTVRWLECRGRVTADATGRATGTIGSVVDVTDRKAADVHRDQLLVETREAAMRLARLQRSSQRLSGAATEQDVIDIALELVVGPPQSSIRMIWIHDPGSEILRLAGHRGLGPVAAARFAEVGLRSELPAAVALRERRTIVAATAEEAQSLVPAGEELAPPTGGFVLVPVVADDGPLGVLAFGGEGRLDQADVIATEAAAGLIGQTLSRVRLTDALRRRATEAAAARDGERRRREYFEFLVAVTQAAASSATSAELMEAVASAAVPTLGDWCRLHFAPEPGIFTTADAHTDASAESWAAALREAFPFDPAAEQGLARVLSSGKSERIEALTPAQVEGAVADGIVDPALREAVLRIAGVMTVPLSFDGRPIGVLQVLSARPRAGHDREDVALAETVAERISPALENLWRADRERMISLSLQAAFLPPRLPTVDRIDLAARYLPASVAADVGGDFYDVFRIDDHRWALLIGDVCGTGADAAALAGIVRHTARAAARHGHDPVTVLEWVNDAVRHSDRDLFCTMLYAILTDDPSGEGLVVTATSGGHPLPILVDGDGARFVGTPGSLLGAFESINLRPCTFTVGPDEWLVAYTDGITDLPEPHGLSDAALLALVQQLATCSATVDEVAAGIERDLDSRAPARARRDDVAMLIARGRRPA
ncbi:MAG TPA: SpoIIE family protein phosphatase [Acidimicrobiales bacterium]